MGSRIKEEKELEPDMEKDLADPVSPAGSTVADLSPTPTPWKTSSIQLWLLNKSLTVTTIHELHLAAQRGDLTSVKQILSDIDSQITGTIQALILMRRYDEGVIISHWE
ncbi:hypothetical protein F2Q69_00038904 [Brassica cretica]|uniref:Uncharacterized protein n=1 Tax=Brassica cretica TaxID=69181 RepID=A0A8S9SFZ9_BRACR|nr:hypothetical protein F2Q69_00038904 [Brassica cretica]